MGMNARLLTLDRKPWPSDTDEFHYTRVPANEWKNRILKMKAAGVQIISTHVICIHHAEVKGQFD